MIDLTIERFCWSRDGTFGRMMLSGAEYFTVERPWLDNQRMVSCIPVGVYECGPRKYNRGGYDAIEIKAVPNRSHILFHKANLPSQLAGCIAPAALLGCLEGQWAGLQSGVAFHVLMQGFSGLDFTLHIKNLEEPV